MIWLYQEDRPKKSGEAKATYLLNISKANYSTKQLNNRVSLILTCFKEPSKNNNLGQHLQKWFRLKIIDLCLIDPWSISTSFIFCPESFHTFFTFQSHAAKLLVAPKINEPRSRPKTYCCYLSVFYAILYSYTIIPVHIVQNYNSIQIKIKKFSKDFNRTW